MRTAAQMLSLALAGGGALAFGGLRHRKGRGLPTRRPKDDKC